MNFWNFRARLKEYFARKERRENLEQELRFLKNLRHSPAFARASPQLKEVIRFEMYGLREKLKELDQ